MQSVPVFQLSLSVVTFCWDTLCAHTCTREAEDLGRKDAPVAKASTFILDVAVHLIIKNNPQIVVVSGTLCRMEVVCLFRILHTTQFFFFFVSRKKRKSLTDGSMMQFVQRNVK